ncbi:flavin-binding monooxygenase-like family protein [Mycena olivaceomarginata]|nr:flavin-binding monooxygenase-like family protein [Mycena olivaceomarginata]
MEIGDAGVAVPDPAIRQKYIEERNKRMRADGLGQFVRLADSTQFKHLQDDPWVDHAAFNAKTPVLSDGDDIKFLVLGAGYGGLLFAVHLIEAGFSAADIRMADGAGGFGGTWYWNRYPGLMCDTESYIYMPLLEETGYMPRFKYAYGPELRAHADRIAEKWGLTDKALFRTQSRGAQWDDAAKRWIVQLVENRGPTEPKKEIKITAQYVLLASGILDAPHIPRALGFEHLKDKRVGVLGTGATAVQAVPHLAKWAKHLYVFQRTPSSVDVRNQRPTDPVEWANKIAAAKGWQRARSENFNSYLVNAPIGEDLVNDGWCHAPSYQAIPDHIARLHAIDLERSEKIRARTSEVVQDPGTAEKLKHWYPAWCKRPAFHDDYLPTFNRPNVTLVDTDGKGVEALTADAVVVDGTPYPIDVLVLSTGLLRGRRWQRGVPRSVRKWVREGPGTLHGVATHGFPNFFFLGFSQAGLSPNFTYTLALLASHVGTTLAKAERRAGASDRITVEVTKGAEEEWAGEILKRASWFAALQGCTPSYMGKVVDPVEQLKAARGATWAEGIVSFTEVIRAWEDEGS